LAGSGKTAISCQFSVVSSQFSVVSFPINIHSLNPQLTVMVPGRAAATLRKQPYEIERNSLKPEASTLEACTPPAADPLSLKSYG